MKIGIFGAGALGSLLGAYLSKKHDVTLYGRQNHIEKISSTALKILGINGEKEYELRAVSELSDEHFDLGIVGVKTYDTDNLLNYLKNNRIKFDLVASIQNGLKDDKLISSFGLERVLGCVVNEAAKMTAPGEIYYSNKGATYFGIFKEENNTIKQEMAEDLTSVLNDCGLLTGVSNDLETLTWYKFMNCVSGFAVSGALNYNAVELFNNDFALELLLDSLEEIKTVSLAENILLGDHPLLLSNFLIDRKESKLKFYSLGKKLIEIESPVSSLVQDIRLGKKLTEADSTLGVLLDKAQNHNLSAKTIEICYKMIKSRERVNQFNFS